MKEAIFSVLRGLWAWGKWPLALLILVLLFWQQRDGLGRFLEQEKHWPTLMLAFVLCGSGICLTFVRWHWLVVALGFPFKLRDAFRLGLMGTAVGYVGPGLIGGDSFKAIAIASGQSSRRIIAAATVFLDRILGLLALLWVGAGGAWLSQSQYTSELHMTVRSVFWVASACGTVGLILLMFPQITHSRLISWATHLPVAGRILRQLLDGLSLYQQRPFVLLGATLMAVVGHSLMIAGLYCCALGLGGWAPSLAAHLYFTPAAEIIGLIPTPSGIGPQEFAITEGYVSVAGAQVSAESARRAGFFASIAFRLIHISIAALGAVFYFTSKEITHPPTQMHADNPAPSSDL